MMASKPTYIDIRPKHPTNNPNILTPFREYQSPRLHQVGQIPPELSPLDAFAAQSRLLAQKLEENSQGDNRISRLLPDAIAQSFNHVQPVAYGSISSSLPHDRPLSPDSPSLSGQKTTVEIFGTRHMSICPTLCDQNDREDAKIMVIPNHHLTPVEDDHIKNQASQIHEAASSYFGALETQSCTSSHGSSNIENLEISPIDESQFDPEHSPQHKNTSCALNDDLVSSNSNTSVPNSLPLGMRSPSPSSIYNHSSDDDFNSANKRLTPVSRVTSRNEHSSSSISPSSQYTRRCSNSSEASTNTANLSKSLPYNFSRPMAPCSTSTEFPMRNESLERSQSVHASIDEIPNISPAIHSEGFSDYSAEITSAPNYVNPNNVLPRGKIPSRKSELSPSFPLAQNPVRFPDHVASAPHTPLIKPITSSFGHKSPLFNQISLSSNCARPSTSSSASSMPSLGLGYVPFDWPVSAREANLRPGTITSIEHASIYKNKTMSPTPSTADLSASEHVEKAIEYHQAGILNKSTYHLRLAAKKGHPTGMLLYALACRHGWGMRPNQREGVAWLRKAADEAVLEIADDENLRQSGKQVDTTELKGKKAQFALSIYELGVSHMNGWGIEQDKALGLRCFEIAGSWGDADAMAEAGFCYARGVGCKKNLKKSAKFYREAEAKGFNVIGNSWIHKAKYNDEPNSKDKSNAMRANTSSSKESMKSVENSNKLRSRGIFRRSKVTTAT